MQKMSNEEYNKYVARISPKSPIGKNCLIAFLVGGAICVIGQLLLNFYGKTLALDETAAGAATSVTLIFLSALFTGLGLYGKLAKHAGAGTLVPITGFANAIAAPAIEFKSEGYITGTAVKMFTIAGPVIVYGVSASVVFGIICWMITLF
ncbi:MAG: stage V sporulation protein AC [Clostridia bacterium]|nr:stage V sporulation protein AC [Clostridia bacterium]